MTTILQVNEVCKSFGTGLILDKLSLEVSQNEIFGLLGLNGAGKTTLFKCILQLLKIDSGTISYRGEKLELPVIHEKIGYLPEFYLPPGELRAAEYLKLLSIAVGSNKPDVEALLKKADLAPDKMIRDYSRGMIQRLGVLIALLKSPEFVILDEPTLGLDPLARINLLNWLKELNQQGTTIMLSSHDFDQVQKLCQRIAVMHRHKIRYIGSISEFINKHSANSLEEAFLKETGEINE